MMTRIRMILFSAFMLFCLSSSALQAGAPVESDAPAEDLSVDAQEKLCEAMQKFAHWRDSLDSLNLVYSWEDPRSFQTFLSRHSSSPEVPRVYRTDLKWNDWWNGADAQMMKASTECLDPELSTVKTVSGRRDNVQYFAEFADEQTIPRLLTTANIGTKRTFQANEQIPLYPIYFAINGWFSGAFQNEPLQCMGTRMIDGCLCVGISHEGGNIPFMWLDLEHDGLPRMIEPYSSVTPWVWKCDEFMKTESGLWFPRKGTFGFVGKKTARFEVELVQVNQPLSPASFNLPKVSKATYVRDLTDEGTPLIMASVEEQRSEVMHANAFSWWRINCSLIVMVISGLWLRWRKKSDAILEMV